LQRYGSVANLKKADADELSRMVPRKIAEKIVQHMAQQEDTA